MIVVIFGAAGFIGRNVVNKLREKNVELIATDIAENPFKKNVNCVRADILDSESVREVVGKADVVMHLAASPLLTSMERPQLNMKINIEGTLNILEASRNFNIDKVIFSSASSIVGDVKYTPVDEEHPCVPKTPYAVAKKTCEDYLRVYKDIFDLDYLIFRFFNVYGPWQYPESGALIPKIYVHLSQGKAFNIYGDGTATRDYVYVEDVADFCYEALRKDVRNEIVNLGTGKATSIIKLVDLASEILGVEPKLVYKTARAGEISNFVADTTKLERLFGRKPSTPLRDGLKHTFKWLESVSERQ